MSTPLVHQPLAPMAEQLSARHSLVVPATDEAPSSCRLFVGAVLGGDDHDTDSIADAKLAVSEAATLVVQSDAQQVTVQIDGNDVRIGPLDDSIRSTVGWDVIVALFPNATVGESVAFRVT